MEDFFDRLTRKQLAGMLDNPKKITYFANGMLFLAHFLFIFFFYSLGATVMFYYNFVSVLTYLVCFFIIRKDLLSTYVIIMYVEIFLFMILGTICLGWDIGFHVYTYGFLVSTMFTDFFLGSRETLRTRTYILLVMVIVNYLFLRVWTWEHPYIYKVDNMMLTRAFDLINTLLVFGFVIAFILVYALNAYRMQKDLKAGATHDMLTGLYNRRYMQELLASKIDKNEYEGNIGVAIFDIDFFKKVNDTYGHDAGDEVLKSFSNRIVKVRTDMMDTVCSRWGGEEFLILFTPVRKLSKNQFKAEVIDIVESVRRGIEHEEVVHNDVRIHITMTAGVTFYEDGITDTEIFKNADRLLYYGKEHGRNQVVSSIPEVE